MCDHSESEVKLMNVKVKLPISRIYFQCKVCITKHHRISYLQDTFDFYLITQKYITVYMLLHHVYY